MTLGHIAQRFLAGLATGVFVVGSAILAATLLLVNSQDFAVANTVYFEIYPLFLLTSWLCTIAIVFLRYPVFKALLLMVLFLLIGGSGCLLLTVLMALVGVLTGDGATPDTIPIRGATAVFVILLLSASSAGVIWQARRMFENPQRFHPLPSENSEA